jgi:hypothetical protein
MRDGFAVVVRFPSNSPKHQREDRTMNRIFTTGIAVGGALLAALSVQAEWYLTNNALDDINPVTAGKLVAWEVDDTNDLEVMLYNGKANVQLTDNEFDDYDIAVAKKYVVWVHDLDGTGTLNEIMLWNGKETVQISNGGGVAAMGLPKTDGKYVVWEQDSGDDWEIMLWDGSTVTNISNNAYDDFSPRVDKGRVVWFADDGGGDDDVFLWDDGVVTRLTDSVGDDQNPVIEGKLVAWVGDDTVNGDTDVFVFDGMTTTNISLATDDVGGALSISKKCVAWSENDGVDAEVYLYEKGVVTQITDNAIEDTNVANYGNKLVWFYDDPNGNNNQVMYRNGKGLVTQLTNTKTNSNLQFNGKSVVWQRTEVDREIYIFPGKTKLP